MNNDNSRRYKIRVIGPLGCIETYVGNIYIVLGDKDCILHFITKDDGLHHRIYCASAVIVDEI